MMQTIKMHGWPLCQKYAITTLNRVGKWALWVHRMRQIACWRGCFFGLLRVSSSFHRSYSVHARNENGGRAECYLLGNECLGS